MHTELNLEQIKKEWKGNASSYAKGLFLSFFFTLLSFSLVFFKPFSNEIVLYLVVFLALLQAGCQLKFFLHLGQEAKPKWETGIFYLMLLVLVIIALGSLWIMDDLEKRVMSNMNMKEMKHD